MMEIIADALKPPRERVDASRRSVRVLHVIPSLRRGGMETALLGHLGIWGRPSLSADQHAVVILGQSDADLHNHCASVRTWSLDIRGRSWRAAWRLRSVIRSFTPDIVHARTTGTWLDAAVATSGLGSVRLGLSFHGREHVREPGWVRRGVLAWATRRAAAVVTLSYDSADWIRRTLHVPTGKITVIPNGIDLQRFCPQSTDAPSVLRRNLLAPNDRLLVLCVANLVPIKGLDVLLAAWRRVRMVVPDVRLIIAGDGPERERLADARAALRIDSSVTLLGRQTDVPELLRAADLFVLPSHYECCSNALLEAMASGLPCVSTTGGGNPEILTAHHTGWLVPPGDAPALAEAIISALLNPQALARVGIAARHHAQREHCVAHVAERYRDWYHRLASSTPARETRQEVAACAG